MDASQATAQSDRGRAATKFCGNTDPKEILGDDSNDVEGDIDDEERENEE